MSELVAEGVGILQHEANSKKTVQTERPRKKKPKEEATSDVKPEPDLPITISYQSWYTRALPVVKLIIPDRYSEFTDLYKLEKRRTIDAMTYTISDYLLGITVTRGIYKEPVIDPYASFTMKFQHQILILRSCSDRLNSALSDIRSVLQAELFDEELEAASELLSKGHIRPAGVLAGVEIGRAHV